MGWWGNPSVSKADSSLYKGAKKYSVSKADSSLYKGAKKYSVGKADSSLYKGAKKYSVSKADAPWQGANLLSLCDISLNKGIALYKGANFYQFNLKIHKEKL